MELNKFYWFYSQITTKNVNFNNQKYLMMIYDKKIK